MNYITIDEDHKDEYNKVVTHPLQSYEWGEFRKKTGIRVVRKGLVRNGEIIDGFTATVHKVPKLKYNIGYVPKCNKPTKEILSELKKIGSENKCIFIQIEPVTLSTTSLKLEKDLQPSFHPLFTKYSFLLDLQKSEEELLKSFHSKTRYNIKVATKHNVKVAIDNSEKAFKEYLRLTEETTRRQGFFAHTLKYHKTMWKTLGSTGDDEKNLVAYLITARYENAILTAWILFTFHDTLYYPYGASSSKNRNVMASNLVMWEAIKFGKRKGLKCFDMWGALGPNPDINDPWYGFHKFKEGYGPTLTEFSGSYDLVINPVAYQLYKIADKARWMYLRLRRGI